MTKLTRSMIGGVLALLSGAALAAPITFDFTGACPTAMGTRSPTTSVALAWTSTVRRVSRWIATLAWV